MWPVPVQFRRHCSPQRPESLRCHGACEGKGVVTIPLGADVQQADGDSVDPALLGVARATMAGAVAERLITAIAVGTYSPGERLPPERELAERLSVSRVTIRQALQQVGELGLVEARRGRGGGTFVTALSRGGTSLRSRPAGRSRWSCPGCANCSTTAAWSRG